MPTLQHGVNFPPSRSTFTHIQSHTSLGMFAPLGCRVGELHYAHTPRPAYVVCCMLYDGHTMGRGGTGEKYY